MAAIVGEAGPELLTAKMARLVHSHTPLSQDEKLVELVVLYRSRQKQSNNMFILAKWMQIIQASDRDESQTI